MYEAFYGFREKPFSLLPDPGYLYLSEQHQMAMTLLEYSLENQAGFCVISGNIGTGKTTLIRYLLNRIGNDISVGLISNTHQSFGELLRWILHAFNLESAGESKAEMHQVFSDYLIAQYARNRRTMIIVDEAQNMSPAALEELRMLSNINSEKDLVLQVMLVGQPGLRELLQRPELEQLTQRVAVDYHLKPLSGAETHGYIRHRVGVVGGNPELFSDAACDAVHHYSGGTPRLINLLCDLVLVYAYAEQRTAVSRDLVEQVVRERQAHGVLPIFATGALPPEHSREAAATAKVATASRPASMTAPATPRTETPVDTNAAAARTSDVPVAGRATQTSNIAGAAGTAPAGAHRPDSAIPTAAPASTASSDTAPQPVTELQGSSASFPRASDSAGVSQPGATESVTARPDATETALVSSIPVRAARRWWVAGIAAGVVIIGAASAWWFTQSSPTASQTAVITPASVAPPPPADSASAAPDPQAGATMPVGPIPGAATTAGATTTPNANGQSPATVPKPEPATSAAIAKPREHATHATPVATRRTPARTAVSHRDAITPKAVEPAKSAAPAPAPVSTTTDTNVVVEKVAETTAPAIKTVAEAAPAPMVVAPVVAPVASKPPVSAPRAEESRSAAPVKAAAESATEFAADPCKGAAARFMSTCKQ